MTLPDQFSQHQAVLEPPHPWLMQSNAGSDEWWQRIHEQGAPLIEPSRSPLCRVTFVWRDSEGCASQSSCQNVWLCINCLTDHHSMQPPVSLTRLVGTDIWYRTLVLNAQWCGSYCFIPDDGALGLSVAKGVDPTAAADVRTQQWHALRTWWRSALPHGQEDPFNAGRRWISGRGHAASALHMPDATVAGPWRRWDRGEALPDPERAATWWQHHRWQSALLGNTRSVWVMTTGRRRPSHRPLAVLLDGRFWTQQMPLPGALIEMTREGQLPEATYLFIDSIDNATRREELTCNPLFWQAVHEELLPQAQHWARFDDSPSSALVAGQSFGGLSALYAGLHWPERFGKVLAQSGSFWWPRRDLMLQDALPDDACWLLRQMEEGLGQQHPLALYIEAGRQEHLIHHVHGRLLTVLEQQAHQVHYRAREGGHDALWWRDGLLDGLRCLWRELPHPPLA